MCKPSNTKNIQIPTTLIQILSRILEFECELLSSKQIFRWFFLCIAKNVENLLKEKSSTFFRHLHLFYLFVSGCNKVYLSLHVCLWADPIFGQYEYADDVAKGYINFSTWTKVKYCNSAAFNFMWFLIVIPKASKTSKFSTDLFIILQKCINIKHWKSA